MKVAAIGIGSNSLRMLQAEIDNGQLVRLKRDRDGLRLFAALDANNCIPDDMIRFAAQKVKRFCDDAYADGAERVHIFATSAVRDAKNRQQFARQIKQTTGKTLDICDGSREANLSFWGACGKKPCALIDIGGGSTEIAVGIQKEVEFAESMQIGAVRLFRESPIAGVADAYSLAEKLQLTDHEAIHKENLEWIGVGGTFTTCAALCQKIPWDHKAQIHGYQLKRESVAAAINELAPLSVEERIKLDYIQPQRADIILHGLVILLACFDKWHIDTITVSEYGNLEGYLKWQYLFSEKVQ